MRILPDNLEMHNRLSMGAPFLLPNQAVPVSQKQAIR
jgi:hypothetical protein